MIKDKIMRRLLDNQPFNLPGDGSLLCGNSRGYFMTIKCDQCAQDIDFILWFIVDGEKRPELLQQIAKGRLHDPECPHCGHSNHLESDLLLFRPNEEPVLLFSPARGTNPAEEMKVGRSFLLKLKNQLGTKWNNEWYEKDGQRGIFIIERSILPLVIQKEYL